jgi:hypothetical protein
MEFTRDVDEGSLKAMRQALTPPRVIRRTVDPHFYFHYFDKDNVQISKQWVAKLDGELSGKKGDAFRLYLPWGSGTDKVVKIDGRPVEKKEPAKDKPEKDKDKPKTDKPKDK